MVDTARRLVLVVLLAVPACSAAMGQTLPAEDRQRIADALPDDAAIRPAAERKLLVVTADPEGKHKDDAVRDEAAVAVLALAEGFPRGSSEAQAAAQDVLAATPDAALQERAKALLASPSPRQGCFHTVTGRSS